MHALGLPLHRSHTAVSTQNATLYSNRAFAYIRLEQYGAAIADASKAIELDPKCIKASLRSRQ